MNGSVVHYLDSSRCQERLGTMIHLARVLRSETGEATESGTLELLSILVDDDVIQLKEAHSLHEENVERLARAVNRPVSVVRSLLRQFLIKDLFDYQSYYAMRLAAYAAENKNGLLEKRLEMRYGDPKIVVPFLYHDVVYCWDTRTEFYLLLWTMIPGQHAIMKVC